MQPTKHSYIRTSSLNESEFKQVFLPSYSDGEIGGGVVRYRSYILASIWYVLNGEWIQSLFFINVSIVLNV